MAQKALNTKKSQKKPPLTYALLFENIIMSSTQMLAAFSNLAISQFVVLYDAVAEKKGLSRPPCEDLVAWMKEEMMILDKTTASELENREDPIKEQPQVNVEPEVEKNVQEPEVSGVKKIDAKDLKKLTYKQTRIIKKGEKEGEEIQEDVLFEMPYLPHCVDYSKTCQAICLNGGLLTPCLTRPSKGSLYCKSCNKEGLKYGTLADRENVPIGEYKVQVSGKEKTMTKKEISYGTWLSKRGTERSFVEKLIADHGLELTIPDSYYEVAKTKAQKRPVKRSPSVSSDGETSSIEETASVNQEENAPSKKEHALEVALAMSAGATVVVEKKKAGRPKKAKAPVDPDAPKKKRGRPKKDTKPVVDGDAETGSEESVQPEPQPEASEEQEPTPEVVEEPKPAEEQPKQENGMKVTNLTEADEDGYRYFDYNGKSYVIDDENSLILNGSEDDELTYVGTWCEEESKPEFNSDYEP